MKLNFRKIAAITGSVMLTGMTLGIAAAANYPAPFVTSGVGNVAIVTGSGAGVSALDTVQAGNIQTSLGSYVTSGTSTVSGEAVSLDTSTTRIYLNTSLNTAKSVLTKSDLPTVLADSSFSGDASATLTQTISLVAGANDGLANSGKVIFAKQPSSSDDPVVGLSIGSSQTSNPLYNATVTFSSAINFTDSNSQGQIINLFGKDYTVSSDSSAANGIVLFQSAQTVTLSQGGTTGSDSATVSIDGSSHTVQLLNAGTSSATISVDGSSQSINTGSSKKINGVSIAVTSVQSSTAGGNTATVLVGAKKLSFLAGTSVTEGDSNSPIDGTYVYMTGGVGATTQLTVSVFRPDSSNDAVLAGDSFTDPVFGSFKLSYSGLSQPLDDASRETVTVENSGSDKMDVKFTDYNGNNGTVDFAYNRSNVFNLSDSSGYPIFPYEMANLSENSYVVLGNENYGHLLEVTRIYNNTGSTVSNDQVQFKDVMSGDTYNAVFASTEGSGTLTLDGKQYTVTFAGSGDSGWAQVKYPTSDSAANDVVLYPTIQTQNGAKLALYAPETLSLDAFAGISGDIQNFQMPDGSGYTPVTVAYLSGNGTTANWTIGGTNIYTGSAADNGGLANSVNVTIGKLTYNFAGSSTVNDTTVTLVTPGASGRLLNEPGIVIFEPKDTNNNYNAVVVDLEHGSAASSTEGVGINDVYFTSTGYNSGELTLQSNTDLAKAIDWFGTLATIDSSTSSQHTATISIPKEQTYAQLYMGEESSTTSSGGALGNVIVKDTDVSSVSGKNLVIVGGSCINSAAATALGVPAHTCGEAFTAATGVGAGQFLIKGVQDAFSTGKLALVVAGYDQPDTVNAATYLTKKTVDTSKTYIGTSATEATMKVA
jgi:hypothetical protein